MFNLIIFIYEFVKLKLNNIYKFIFCKTAFIHGEILYSLMYLKASEEYLNVSSSIYLSSTFSKRIYYFNTF